MTLEVVFQAVLLGLLQGGVYALVACGLTLIYGVMKIVNFAHAEFLTLGMYLAISAFQLGASPYLVAVFIFCSGCLLGCRLAKGAHSASIAASTDQSNADHHWSVHHDDRHHAVDLGTQ